MRNSSKRVTSFPEISTLEKLSLYVTVCGPSIMFNRLLAGIFEDPYLTNGEYGKPLHADG